MLGLYRVRQVRIRGEVRWGKEVGDEVGEVGVWERLGERDES